MALHHAGAKPEADSGGWAVNAGRHIEAVEQPGEEEQNWRLHQNRDEQEFGDTSGSTLEHVRHIGAPGRSEIR